MSSGDASSLDRPVVALVATGLLILATGVGIGILASGAGFAGSGVASGGGDNGSVAHRDPATVGDTSDLSTLERQLAQQAIERVQSGAINLSQEDYEQVQNSLEDSEYESLLDRYAEVASQTGDENRSELLRSLRKNQRAYAAAAEAYRNLRAVLADEANLVAPDNRSTVADLSFVDASSVNRTVTWRLFAVASPGPISPDDLFDWNESERRQIVRELDDRWRRVNETGATLIRNYRQLEALGPGEYDSAITAVRTTRRNISETQERLRDRWLVGVRLEASAVDPRGSFVDPIRIDGRLVTEDDGPVANETVTLRIASQTYRTRTNAAGEFSVAYRPTLTSLNATKIPVEFVPNRSSAFATAETNVSVAIERAEPTVSVGVTPSQVAFNETLVVSGRVGSDGAGAANVTYLVSADGELLAQNTTDSDGTFESRARLPADVASGNREVRVALVVQNQALAPTNGTAAIQITDTPATLSMTATHTDRRSLNVSGRLTVPEHGGVADREVRIEANGTLLGTVATGPAGSFDTTVVVPKSLLDKGLGGTTTSLTVRAIHDGQNGNIGSATAESSVVVGSGGFSPWLVGVIVAGFGILGTYLGYRRWRTTRRNDERDSGTASGSAGGIASTPEDRESLLDVARAQLSAGRPDVAVQFGYAAVRSRFEAEIGPMPSATHWEFYRACCEQLDDEDNTEFLRRVSELYERAVYAADSVSEETVSMLLAELEETVDDRSSADD